MVTPEGQQSNIPGWWVATLGLVSFVGFLDATYLTVTHFLYGATPCTLLKGCEIVTGSQYSTLFGLPIALFGVLFYLTVLVLTLWYWDSGNTKALTAVAYLSILAFLASLGLVFIQAFILHAFCIYCLVSALSSTIIFMLGMSYLTVLKSNS